MNICLMILWHSDALCKNGYIKCNNVMLPNDIIIVLNKLTGQNNQRYILNPLTHHCLEAVKFTIMMIKLAQRRH